MPQRGAEACRRDERQIRAARSSSAYRIRQRTEHDVPRDLGLTGKLEPRQRRIALHDVHQRHRLAIDVGQPLRLRQDVVIDRVAVRRELHEAALPLRPQHRVEPEARLRPQQGVADIECAHRGMVAIGIQLFHRRCAKRACGAAAEGEALRERQRHADRPTAVVEGA